MDLLRPADSFMFFSLSVLGAASRRWMLVVAKMLRCWNAPVSSIWRENILPGVSGRAHDFHRLVICVFSLPPLLSPSRPFTSSSLPDQMRPMRMSPLDRSTISCPGNRAGSSSDSKRITPLYIRHCLRPTKGREKKEKNEGAGDVLPPCCLFFFLLLPQQQRFAAFQQKLQPRAPPHGQLNALHVSGLCVSVWRRWS